MHAPFASRLRSEWKPLAALEGLRQEWDTLAGAAIEPNVFYEPDFLLPAMALFDPQAGAVIARNESGRLVGFFPVQVRGWRQGYAPALASTFMHPFGPLGKPLVAPGFEEGAIDTWLDHIAHDGGPHALLMPLLPDTGPFAGALDRVLARRELGVARYDRHVRAQLLPDAQRTTYLERAVGLKARKNLARKRRRLGELGMLSRSQAFSPAAMKEFFADFLTLEAAGWKGRMGTAAAQDSNIAGFMERVLCRLAKDNKAFGERLSIDGKPIAITFMLRSGGSVWAWKIAYDEAFAHYSPGVQIALDVTQTLLDDASVTQVDSCAGPDHPMIDHLWRERLALSDRLISLRPGRLASAAGRAGYAARHAAFTVLKGLRNRTRRPAFKRAPATTGE